MIDDETPEPHKFEEWIRSLNDVLSDDDSLAFHTTFEQDGVLDAWPGERRRARPRRRAALNHIVGQTV
jgi:hypothetical protein